MPAGLARICHLLCCGISGSALGRSSGDQDPEPACTPKPTGNLGLMTDTNPLPPKFSFCQLRLLFNSLSVLEEGRC